MNTVTSTTGSLPKLEGDFSQTNFILSCLPAQGLNTAWLCFVSANIYHGFSAAWGVIGKSLVATTFNKVIRSRDWLSFSIVRNGLLRWHVVGTERDVPFEEKVGTAPFLICFGWWHTGFKVLIPSCLAEGTREVPELTALMTSSQRIFRLSFEGHFGAYQGLKIDTTFP